jgi:hypothetical protein
VAEDECDRFLVSGIAATVPAVVGQPYRDASGNEYLPMFVQLVLVYEADVAALRRAYQRAIRPQVRQRRSQTRPRVTSWFATWTMEPSKPSAIAEQLGHPAVYSART